MGSRKKRSKLVTQLPREAEKKKSPAEYMGSVILAAGAIIAAYIAYSATIRGTSLPIEATQTAETRLTAIAMTTEFMLVQTIDTPIPSSVTPSGTAAHTDTPVPSETPSPMPTEAKPVKYEYTVKSNDTLDIISRKFFVTESYATAIGRANCNISPIAGDTLVIRYYYIQQGDTLDSIAGRFGGSVSFLRSINGITRDVISPPVGQILILPGDCSGS